MKVTCPYCATIYAYEGVSSDFSFPKFGKFHPYTGVQAAQPGDKQYRIDSHKCPQCAQQIMWLVEIDPAAETEGEPSLLYPKRAIKEVHPNIPAGYANDLREAHEILEISPRASAALSRRSLQMLIRDKEGIQERDLCLEIKNCST